jgi:hypothetical protein
VNAVGNPSSVNLDDFSLAKGGPLFKFLIRTPLMRPDLSPAGRRTVFLVLFTWFPLLLLSAWQGLAIGEGLKIPFLFDFNAAVRFLVCFSLLGIAEIDGARLRKAAEHIAAAESRQLFYRPDDGETSGGRRQPEVMEPWI